MTVLPDRVRRARDRIRTGDLADPAMAVTFVLGLILAPLHWTGLVVAGGLLGLTAPTVRRAVVLGTTYGLVLLGLFAVWLVVHGALGKFLAMGELALATVALGISLPLLAAGAVRGLT